MQGDLIPIPPFLQPLLERAGVDFQAALLRTGARPQAEGGRWRLNTAQFFAFWNAVEAAGVAPGFGLQLPSSVASHQFDVASAAALLSENFGEALARLARYKRLTCPEDIELTLTGTEAQVRLLWLRAGSAVPSLVIDGVFAWLYQLAGIGTGMSKTLRPLRIELTRAPAHEALLGQHFGCPIHFNAPSDLIVFAQETLTLPFTSHHPEMLELMLPGLEAALKARAASASLTQQVREILARRMRGQRPSVELVARDLCMSPRTLQRRLEEESASYQRLLDDVRQETARHLLSATNLDAGEIAFVLGFEELNSFTRAFQGWEGTSPNRWRTNKMSKMSNKAQAGTRRRALQ